jgi:hypothetical protein
MKEHLAARRRGAVVAASRAVSRVFAAIPLAACFASRLYPVGAAFPGVIACGRLCFG